MRKYSHRLLDLLNRDHLPRFLNLNYPQEKMVEVGTYHGDFAHHIATHWKGELYCVDPWEDQNDAVYRDGCANGGVAGGINRMQPIYESACNKLRNCPSVASIIRAYSVDAMTRFSSGSLACVYIDGNHAYENCLQDLNGWWTKIRIGGLIATHDCYIRKDAVQNCGVWDAVWDFSQIIDEQPFLTNCGSAWWIKQ